MIAKTHVPVYVLCEDGRFYVDLVYGDDPRRYGWFLCFDPKEPAEIVIKESEYAGGNFGPLDILNSRGFGKVLTGVFNGRRDPHMRYFGGQDAQGRPLEGAMALSWFCLWREGVFFGARP